MTRPGSVRARSHREGHATARIGWLRAAVLGANDGILSVASIVMGVSAGRGSPSAILLAGVAGLVAGAMSMAAGEFVSVSSQADSEAADLARERAELEADPHGEHAELVAIYRARGLDEPLAEAVATQLGAYDALATHAREELGLTDAGAARPIQAALASAASFAAGGIIPVLLLAAAPRTNPTPLVFGVTIVLLAVLGAAGAMAGGAPPLRGALRVAFWGAAAMIATTLIGHLAGVAI